MHISTKKITCAKNKKNAVKLESIFQHIAETAHYTPHTNRQPIKSINKQFIRFQCWVIQCHVIWTAFSVWVH